MAADLDLTRFKVLSFDCYGTLIDWETGIGGVLAAWAADQGLEIDAEDLLSAFAEHETVAERAAPGARYPDILAAAFRSIGEALDAPVDDHWTGRLGGSVGDWPAFDDSADALGRLAQHYRLVIVSNVHRDGFAASNRQLRGDFVAVITAEDVGAYKPALAHFDALGRLLDELGVGRDELLHVAQSLFHDHVPAKRVGLHSVWIDRRHDRGGSGATPPPEEPWSAELTFTSMAEFADAVDRAFSRPGPPT